MWGMATVIGIGFLTPTGTVLCVIVVNVRELEAKSVTVRESYFVQTLTYTVCKQYLLQPVTEIRS
jgi:hypothetical protein